MLAASMPVRIYHQTNHEGKSLANYWLSHRGLEPLWPRWECATTNSQSSPASLRSDILPSTFVGDHVSYLYIAAFSTEILKKRTKSPAGSEKIKSEGHNTAELLGWTTDQIHVLILNRKESNLNLWAHTETGTLKNRSATSKSGKKRCVDVSRSPI